MEILSGGGEIADLNVVLGALLEETLEAPAGVFRPLAFVSMRKQEHDAAGGLPFRFRRGDKLIDNRLRTVSKIAELRFPKAKHVRVINRVTVIEPEDGGFRQRAVVDANAGLVIRQVK